MPTLSSRPQVDEDIGEAYSIEEVVDMITDAILYVMPQNMIELKMALHVVCRTLWNTDVIEDFYIYDNLRTGYDVGFKLYDDPHYNVIQIN